MFIHFFFSCILSSYPKIETYKAFYSQDLKISLQEGSLVFINTYSYTSDNFIFRFESNNQSNTSNTSDLNLNQNNNDTSHHFLSPTPNTHHIFERELCGDFITIIPNLKQIKKKEKIINHFIRKKSNDFYPNAIENIKNSSIILHFWRIPNGLCDINTYVIKSNNIMSIVPRSRSFSRFCFFSSLNFSQKFSYKLNFHATGSLLSGNIMKTHETSFKTGKIYSAIKMNNSISAEFSKKLLNKSFSYINVSDNNHILSSDNIIPSSIDDDLSNFNVELFYNESTEPITMKSKVNYEITQPFLMLGSYEDLQIGKLLLKFQADDSECSATPITKYQISRINPQKNHLNNKKSGIIKKDKKIKLDLDLPLEGHFEKANNDILEISNENNKLRDTINILKLKLLFIYCKLKGKNFCNSNSFSFSYSTLFSPLLSLSTVSIEQKGWKRIDVKCIEKGNDADAGFISLVIILVGMVIFVLIHARKFVIIDSNDYYENQEIRTEVDAIHLDINDIESENENNEK